MVPGESVLANEYLEVLGGKGANSAIATQRACHKKPSDTSQARDDEYEDTIHVKIIGAVGDDRHGERFSAELDQNGIDTSGIMTVPDMHTSIYFVMVNEYTRENRCLFTLGATAAWKKEHFMRPENLGNGVRPDLVVAQMEINKESIEIMIETAGQAGIDLCLNAAPATPIAKGAYRHITHLLVNESEAAIMSGRGRNEVNEDTWQIIAQEFLTCGVKNVVVTLGERGAFYANGTESGHCPAYDVKVVDTTGAG
ncbi:hypothetical protein SLS62_008485 [Diatrype stigma]|uniref:Carbohydrate kinase PfkB domain-containing protein n=1 Tax=Diatrype stigma TaxID=117547 RepID=A0AAN9YNZ2_9PEZI